MKQFYRKQFSNYLGEQRAILDIVIGFTPNPSQTPTPSPTATLQITPSPTTTTSLTPTPTGTPTQTPTNTATNTPTPTNTGTPTQTPTNTGTPTPTMTPSSSPAVPYQSAVLEVECLGGILLGGDSITVDGAPYPLTTSGGTIGVAGCVNVLIRNNTGIIYRMFYGPNSQVCTSPGNIYDEVRLVNFQYNPAIGLMGGYDYTEQLYMSGVLVGGSVKQTAIINPPADLGNGCPTQDLDLVVTFFVETILPTPTPTVTATNTSTPTNTPTPTNTGTPTNTPTNTGTGTPTPTPTNTGTPTNTPTPTNTGTPTNTPTNTGTGTPTPTPTNTGTPTNTPTPTNTGTPTPTPTPTSSPLPDPIGFVYSGTNAASSGYTGTYYLLDTCSVQPYYKDTTLPFPDRYKLFCGDNDGQSNAWFYSTSTPGTNRENIGTIYNLGKDNWYLIQSTTSITTPECDVNSWNPFAYYSIPISSGSTYYNGLYWPIQNTNSAGSLSYIYPEYSLLSENNEFIQTEDCDIIQYEN